MGRFGSCQKRDDIDGSPSPRRYRLPCTTPPAAPAVSRSTSVEKVCSDPKRASAAAVEYSVIVDAGCIMSPAAWANRVSPRVSETTMTPNFPLRTRLLIIAAKSLESSLAPRGDVHEIGAGAAGTGGGGARG